MAARRRHRRRQRLPAAAFDALNAGDAKRWNKWRSDSPDARVDLRAMRSPEASPGGYLRRFDLRGADLRGACFTDADLSFADLRGARLDDADLGGARLCGADCRDTEFGEVSLDDADLRDANLSRARFKPVASLLHADLQRADLSGADLRHVILSRSDLSEAVLKGADLRHASLDRADLSRAVLDDADLRHARLSRAVMYETSLNGAKLSNAILVDAFVRRVQTDHRTTQRGLLALSRIWFARDGSFDASFSTVDDLRAASLLSLLGERGAVSSLVNAGSKAVVLILGRFGRRRMPVLRLLSDVLRTKGKIPIIFDFPGPDDRELSDTVRLLATLSEFIIVDLSNPRSVPLELQATIPGLMVPVVPIVEEGREVFAMFQDLQRRYFWVLPPVAYKNRAELASHVESAMLKRVRRVQRQISRRREALAEAPRSVTSFGPGEDVSGAVSFIVGR